MVIYKKWNATTAFDKFMMVVSISECFFDLFGYLELSFHLTWYRFFGPQMYFPFLLIFLYFFLEIANTWQLLFYLRD